MSSIHPPGSGYSPSQAYGSAYKYDDPIDPQIPRAYPNQFDAPVPLPPLQQHTPPRRLQKGQGSGSSEPKVRLRKACDSCSVRKVKCDETGPPCKSCAALDIPCTFDRPSRRRGPPNRHAEAIKRQKLEEANYNRSTGSPTHDAAYSLAALAAPSALSAESICDLPTLEVLLDDYFIYIHPLIPLPHEPTFRNAFARREDRTNRSFLGMIATMIETLVASFPRRPRQLFTSEQARAQFPNAGALIDRCHQVFIEARGLGYLDRPLNFYDAFSSYLAGLASAYTFDIGRMRLYFSECMMMIRGLDLHRPGIPAPVSPQAMASYPPMDLAPPQPADYIYQESGRRLFWLMFVGAMSGRQLDEPEADLLMPPVSHAEMLPPLPVEVDDEYITESTIYPQPPGVVSELTGFNLNVKVFRAFHFLAALEMAFGTDTVFDWDRQRQIIRRALQNVKDATKDAPKELQLNPVNEFGEWPPPSYDVSAYSHFLNGRQPPPDSGHVGPGPDNSAHSASLMLPYPKRAVQFEIQKANIYATQLSTRSYLVERFWNLYDVLDQEKRTTMPSFAADQVACGSSPTAGALVSGVDHSPWQTSGRTTSESTMDAGEQAMAVEREDIVRDMALLLRSINQVNMEPNGSSFCNKIRSVASTLLETKRARMSVMPTLDSESVNNYLYVFLDILTKLERLGPGRIRGIGDLHDHGQGKTPEEIEQEELVHWASLKEHQEIFVRSEGFRVGA